MDVLLTDVVEVSRAVAASISGVIANPHCEIAADADSTVGPISAAGEFMAKYRPGCSTQAAISAITATNASISMPP